MIKVKCHINLVTCRGHNNIYFYQITPISYVFFSYCADEHTRTNRTKTIACFADAQSTNNENATSN